MSSAKACSKTLLQQNLAGLNWGCQWRMVCVIEWLNYTTLRKISGSLKASSKQTQQHHKHHRFADIIQVNLRWLAPPVKNWRILLVQSFTARIPLLTTTSASRLGRRHWSSPQQCYLHCVCTLNKHSNAT